MCGRRRGFQRGGVWGREGKTGGVGNSNLWRHCTDKQVSRRRTRPQKKREKIVPKANKGGKPRQKMREDQTREVFHTRARKLSTRHAITKKHRLTRGD